MAGEGLDFSALRTKQGLQVSVGGVIYSVGMYKEDDLQGLQVYINGINSRVYALDIVEKKRDPGRRMSVQRHLLPGTVDQYRVVVGGVDHLVVHDNGDVQLGGDHGVRVCVDGTVKLGGAEDDHEGRVWIDAEDTIFVGVGNNHLTLRARWSLRRAVRRALKPFGAGLVVGLVVGAVCYALGSSKLAGSGSKAPAAKAPPPASTSSRLRWSRF